MRVSQEDARESELSSPIDNTDEGQVNKIQSVLPSAKCYSDVKLEEFKDSDNVRLSKLSRQGFSDKDGSGSGRLRQPIGSFIQHDDEGDNVFGSASNATRPSGVSDVLNDVEDPDDDQCDADADEHEAHHEPCSPQRPSNHT